MFDTGIEKDFAAYPLKLFCLFFINEIRRKSSHE